MEQTVHLVAGHDAVKDFGAVAKHPKLVEVRESIKNINYRDLLRRELSFLGVKTTVDNDRQGLAEVIRNLRTLAKPQDLIIDIHFNAAANQAATGTEVFVKDGFKPEEMKLATELVKSASDILRLRNRGVKTESQSVRGRLGIMRVPCNVVLLELGFITNPQDVDNYVMWRKILAAKHADIIKDWLK